MGHSGRRAIRIRAGAIISRRFAQIGCAIVRAVHEIFWALIVRQRFGPHPVTGRPAITIPFGTFCAKVYAEILEETDQRVIRALPFGSGAVSVFIFAHLPNVWAQIRNCTLCAQCKQ